MNERADLDRTLRTWMAAGPTEMPDRVVGVVADRIARQPQRRTWRLLGRPIVNSYLKLAAGLAAATIIATAAWQLLPRTGGSGGPPTFTPAPTATGAADPLLGAWVTAASTCADQNAAIQRAGIAADKLQLAGWDAATCIGMTHGSVHQITFVNGQLIQRADGAIGWSGFYHVVDADTFTARDGPWTLTYQFSINGDQLVIDMVDDEKSGTQNDTELWSDIVAQTVIYESGPFTRKP